MNEQELIENPEALLALLQQAVQYLIEQRPDTAEQEAQLRAVAKAIEQLEKQRVPVPDSLRQTKMTLVDQMSQYAQFNLRLAAFGNGLTEVLDMIEDAIGKPRQEEKPEKDSVPRRRRSRNSNLLTTSMSVLRETLIQALTELGGSAHCSNIQDRMENCLKENFCREIWSHVGQAVNLFGRTIPAGNVPPWSRKVSCAAIPNMAIGNSIWIVFPILKKHKLIQASNAKNQS